MKMTKFAQRFFTVLVLAVLSIVFPVVDTPSEAAPAFTWPLWKVNKKEDVNDPLKDIDHFDFKSTEYQGKPSDKPLKLVYIYAQGYKREHGWIEEDSKIIIYHLYGYRYELEPVDETTLKGKIHSKDGKTRDVELTRVGAHVGAELEKMVEASLRALRPTDKTERRSNEVRLTNSTTKEATVVIRLANTKVDKMWQVSPGETISRHFTDGAYDVFFHFRHESIEYEGGRFKLEKNGMAIELLEAPNYKYRVRMEKINNT